MATRRAELTDYDVLDRFAIGGAAELYRARHKPSGEIVVIKRLRTDIGFDPAIAAGFEREAQLAVLCQHKNLIPGFERGTHGGLDWVAVRYVDGRDLAGLLERVRMRKERLAPPMAMYVAREILDGLAFAYYLADPQGGPMGLVHRDLNPRNVLISYEGGVHVADFGSSVASLTEPAADEIVGSVGYLSPEQASAAPLDARSDVFAVGCILLEMVTGEPAFDLAGKREGYALKAHQKGLTKKVPHDVPEQLTLVIEIACALDREDRYMSAAAMRDALDALLVDERAPQLTKRLASLMQRLFAAEHAKARAKAGAESSPPGR